MKAISKTKFCKSEGFIDVWKVSLMQETNKKLVTNGKFLSDNILRLLYYFTALQIC